MEWKLERLLGIMNLAGRVPSRMLKLQQLFHLRNTNYTKTENRKGAESLKQFYNYRRRIIQTCDKRLSKTPPRILLKRIIQHENFNGDHDFLDNASCDDAKANRNEKSFECKICCEMFPTSGFESHMIQIHSLHPCTECGQAFQTTDLRNKHSLTHQLRIDVRKKKCQDKSVAIPQSTELESVPDQSVGDDGNDGDAGTSASSSQEATVTPNLTGYKMKKIKLESETILELEEEEAQPEWTDTDQDELNKEPVDMEISVENETANLPEDNDGASFSDNLEDKLPQGLPRRCKLRQKKRISYQQSEEDRDQDSQQSEEGSDDRMSVDWDHDGRSMSSGQDTEEDEPSQLIPEKVDTSESQSNSSQRVNCVGAGTEEKNREDETETREDDVVNSNDISSGATDQVFKCKKCGKEFDKREKMKAHRRMVHVPHRFKCPICKKGFKRKHALKEHEVTHADPKTWKHKCNLCGMRFHRESVFKLHQEAHRKNPDRKRSYHRKNASQQKVIEKPETDTQNSDPNAMDDNDAKYSLREKKPVSYDQTDDYNKKDENEKDDDFTANASSDNDDEKSSEKNSDEDDSDMEDGRKVKKPKSTEPIKCPKCPATFTETRFVKKHLEALHSVQTNKWICKKCDLDLKTKFELIQHNQSVHQTEPRVSCGQCEKTFQSKYILTRHVKLAHLMGSQECTVCKKVLQSVDSLRRHQLSHQDPESWTFKCSICEKPFQQKWVLRKHMVTHGTGDSIKCTFCKRKFKTRLALTTHCLLKHKDKTETLDMKLVKETSAAEELVDKEIANLKRQRQPKPPSPPAKCEKCGKVYENDFRLRMHMARVHVPATHKCSTCQLKFKTRDDLKKHLRKHADPKTWKFKCSFCSKRFYNNTKMKLHMKRHHSQ